MQLQIWFLGSVFLLIIAIVALIIIVILRDGRELKAKQIAAELSQLEVVVGDLKKIKGDLTPALSSFKKHEATLSQIEGQLRQISSSVANFEHRQQLTGQVAEKHQDDRKDREHGQRQTGKAKSWSSGYKDNRRREYSGAPGSSFGTGEAVASINDGEQYAKVAEMAAHGLTMQEIAKKMNVGTDEISLILNLKGKRVGV